ncbi:MAG: sugar transferase [Nitrospirae bacterium]|nr:sugar transferase [Nitrospirota bacterium]
MDIDDSKGAHRFMDMPSVKHKDEISPPDNFYRLFIKPMFDKMFASVMIISTAPFLLLIALLVKIDSKGPAIFKQQRVGLLGKVFTIYKFRSMKETRGEDTHPFTEKNDPRLTRIGKIIRSVRADELPQLWNVIKGDMSLIGPRPEQVEIVEQLNASLPEYHIRHTIKPGITGWAQVKYKYTNRKSDVPHKLLYDFYYIQHMSFKIDLYIVFATLKVILSGQYEGDI